MQRVVVKRATGHGSVFVASTPREGPIGTVRHGSVLVEAFGDIPRLSRRRKRGAWVFPCAEVEFDYLTAVVHARNQKVVLPSCRRVPFHAPRSAADVDFGERHQRLARVEDANRVVITGDRCREFQQLLNTNWANPRRTFRQQECVRCVDGSVSLLRLRRTFTS